MPDCKYMEENGSAAKRPVGLTQKVNLWEHVTPMPSPSTNKVADSGFKTQRRHYQKSKIGVSVAPQKGHMSFKNLKKNKFSTFSMVIFSHQVC